jgi:hypothetical protein
VGFIETIEAMDLSDEAKQNLIREHQGEMTLSDNEIATLRAQARRTNVEDEIKGLGSLGLAEAPGLLKFIRRVYLSDDAEPGLVLLSDQDMQLAGDDATGATQKEQITTAGAIRKLIELLPRNAEGKLALSDQALLTDAGDEPDKGDDKTQEQKTEDAKGRLGKITGHTAPRTRARYKGTSPVGTGV